MALNDGKALRDVIARGLTVIEVDGVYHAARTAADARRDAALARAGCRVLRIEASLVVNDIEVPFV